MEKIIVVITITCNRLEVTKKWLGELRQKAGYPYRHIVVDNGSTDGTVEWLKENGYEVIELGENMGIAFAMMKAYELANATEEKIDYFMRFDDDCEIITDGVLRKIVNTYREIGDGIVLAPLDVDILPEFQPITFGHIQIGSHKIRLVTHTGGIFQVIPKRAMDILVNEAENGDIANIKKDVIRGEIWRLGGVWCGYLTEVKVEHRGRTFATKDYKF